MSTKPRVLIVDDALFMREMLKEILVGAGYEVVGEAETGAEAVALCQSLRPEVVTLDIVMPGMSGIEALKRIRMESADVKVVMVTAVDQEPMLAEAIAAGASDFVVKPFEPDRVLGAVGAAVGR